MTGISMCHLDTLDVIYLFAAQKSSMTTQGSDLDTSIDISRHGDVEETSSDISGHGGVEEMTTGRMKTNRLRGIHKT